MAAAIDFEQRGAPDLGPPTAARSATRSVPPGGAPAVTSSPPIARPSIEPGPLAGAANAAAKIANARQAGLAIQLELHDKQQFEVRFNYAIADEAGPQAYTVDAFLFVPRNVGVTRANYSRDQFYADVTALMRLDAAPLPLDRLSDPSVPASPLHRIDAALRAFRAADRPPPSRAIAVHVKVYAHLFALGVRADARRLEKLLERERAVPEGTSPDSARKQFTRELEQSLARMQHALRAFRESRAGFWPFEQLAHESVAAAFRAADEYMSLYVEERLAQVVAALEGGARRYDGQAFVPRARALITAFAAREAGYRAHYGYASLARGDVSSGEYFTYRASQIKKTVQQALYLNARASSGDTLVRNAVAGVGAALAAIWTLATQLPGGIGGLPLHTQLLFAMAAVLGYVAKDRIKALTSEALLKRARTFDHSASLSGESLADMGLGSLEGKLREAVRFLSPSQVPADVRALRMARHTVRHADVATEEIVHYRKEIDVGPREGAAPLPQGYRLRDILRVNVRNFIARLDDPLDRVRFFDAASGRFEARDLPKVYHLNAVFRVRRIGMDGAGHERAVHYRVVLNKEGIVRVEEGHETRPAPVQGRPARSTRRKLR